MIYDGGPVRDDAKDNAADCIAANRYHVISRVGGAR